MATRQDNRIEHLEGKPQSKNRFSQQNSAMKRQADAESDDRAVLHEINMNTAPQTNDQPLCKKQKLAEGETIEGSAKSQKRWSLSHSTVVLDEVFDSGLKLIDSSGSSQDEEEGKHAWTENDLVEASCDLMTPQSKERQIALLEATLTKETLQKISLGGWNGVVAKRAEMESCLGMNHFEKLSDEMVLHIFHWLPKCNLSNVALVCKRFHQLAQDKCLWTRMDVSGRYLEPGALGRILDRQIVILRLAQSEVTHPIFQPGLLSFLPDFRSRLMYLDLSMAQIPKQCLVDLFRRCTRLKKVSLEHVPIDDCVLLALSKSKDIEVVNLAMVEGITEDGMIHLLSSCRRLKELNLAWTGLSSDCIKYICLNLPQTMDRLNMSGCQKYMLDKHIADLVSTCPNLRELDLSDCTGLSGQAIEHITVLNDLNFLALSRCYFIPYRSLLQLKTLRSLAYLDIHGGYIDQQELKVVQEALGSKVHINKFKFSSVARPTVGPKRSSIWGLSTRD